MPRVGHRPQRHEALEPEVLSNASRARENRNGNTDRNLDVVKDGVVTQRWSHFLRQPAKVDSPMKRTIHHEDAETVFG